ncbi:VOC family protein [Terrarubrum flagellatum]|uniref:VOC family protein n=1 Tax=Terrirubrum flagellatum TaxID=2895980 RepID=UPI0031451461
MSKIVPCLWFDHQGEEAARFYVETFRACGQEASIGDISYYGEGGLAPKGKVMTVSFTLAGQSFLALNGGPHYTFSPAISLTVKCRDQRELDQFWERLSADKASEQCGWLKDKFGLSWQIVPENIGELITKAAPGRGANVMQALMKMKKLDINALVDAGKAA